MASPRSALPTKRDLMLQLHMRDKMDAEEAAAREARAKREKARRAAEASAKYMSDQKRALQRARAAARAADARRKKDAERREREEREQAADRTTYAMELMFTMAVLENLERGDPRLVEFYDEWCSMHEYDGEPTTLTTPMLDALEGMKKDSVTPLANAHALSIAMLETDAAGVSDRDVDAIARTGAIMRVHSFLFGHGGAELKLCLTPFAYTYGVNSALTGYTARFLPSAMPRHMMVAVPELVFDPSKPSGFVAPAVVGCVEAAISTVPCTVALYPLLSRRDGGSDAEVSLADAAAAVASPEFQGYAVQFLMDADMKLFLCVASPALGAIASRREWVKALNGARTADGSLCITTADRPTPVSTHPRLARLRHMKEIAGRNVREAKARSKALAGAIAAAMGKALPVRDEECTVTVGNTWNRSSSAAEDSAVFFAGCAEATKGGGDLVAWGGPGVGPVISSVTSETEAVYPGLLPRVAAFPMYLNTAGNMRTHAPPLEDSLAEAPHSKAAVVDSDSDDGGAAPSRVSGMRFARATRNDGVKVVSRTGADDAVTQALLTRKKGAGFSTAARALRSIGFDAATSRPRFVLREDTVVLT